MPTTTRDIPIADLDFTLPKGIWVALSQEPCTIDEYAAISLDRRTYFVPADALDFSTDQEPDQELEDFYTSTDREAWHNQDR